MYPYYDIVVLDLTAFVIIIRETDFMWLTIFFMEYNVQYYFVEL